MFGAMFLHGGVGHVIGNMIFLALLGLLVEGALGHSLFLAVYLLGGLGSACAVPDLMPFWAQRLAPVTPGSWAIEGYRGEPRSKVLAARSSALATSPVVITSRT